MNNVEASAEAAQKLWLAADLLSGKNCSLAKFGTTKILLNKAALANGNIASEIGSPRTSGLTYIHRTLNLNKPPIDPPDIAEMNRMTDVLMIFL
ncbi:hypothetical protein HZB78_00235 [Candidatus Collierbacteria bacterium]|nr:hypothetical protein [Candidatus Collierbacteria bacterium]